MQFIAAMAIIKDDYLFSCRLQISNQERVRKHMEQNNTKTCLLRIYAYKHKKILYDMIEIKIATSRG